MTNITKQFPAKPTTNTTEYTATMMGMMGDMGSASASQVPLDVHQMVLNSVRTGRAAGKSPRILFQRVSVRSQLSVCNSYVYLFIF
ncbi:hypothetical protein EYF80_059625 [Liparis tanakae]|uniref:Uncharacterized protein n=1 Tax=Liparis tanakae TaxID=230148 RepID=A0A4Z2EP50_9TELE|nr:hypothetical protein EYF80_059625 [Liparis tanakae]